MASYARRFVAAGVRLVGGCCGTTPEHIRQIQLAADGLGAGASARRGRRRARRPRPVAAAARVRRCRAPRSRASRSTLSRGQFVTAVELLPPRGHAAQALVERGRQLRDPRRRCRARPRRPAQPARGMSALPLRCSSSSRPASRPCCSSACRDRSLPGMQSDLLGAHALGLRNILLVTGDRAAPRRLSRTRRRFSTSDSIGLANAVSRLNHGTDLGGQPIGAADRVPHRRTVNPSSLDLDEELRRFGYKAEAGAEFAMTEPVFDVADVEPISGTRARDVDLPLVVTIRRSAACAKPSGWPTKCPASASRRGWSSGCARPPRPGRRLPKGWPSLRNWSRRCGPSHRELSCRGGVRTLCSQ